MRLSKIGIIISREYQNRVRKKSFLVTTFVVPVLMAALCIVPIVLMMTSKEKKKVIGYVDRSGIVAPFLENGETIEFRDYGDFDADSVKAHLEALGLDAILKISGLDAEKRTVSAEITSLKPLGLSMTEVVNRQIDDAVENYRAKCENIDQATLDAIKSDVHLRSFTVDEQGNEQISNAGVNSTISMVLGLVIFLFVTLFGSMVMSAVIEEKSSRVVEVLISSVKATELMFGKIIGIALVAFTQFLLWIVLTVAIVSTVGGAIAPELFDSLSSDPSTMMQAVGADSIDNAVPLDMNNPELSEILDTLKGLDFVSILVYFLLFFAFGYLLYASLFAAVGSAVENEGDSQQLQLPLTIPLMIAYFIAIYTFNAPDSNLAVWGSLIPFTSPIVMLARIPFGVPDWQIVLSLALLVVTTVVFAWISAKIYKVGILMFGKKTTFKDLWKWLRQS